jgi:F-type H+-transporting ATPase subunit b
MGDVLGKFHLELVPFLAQLVNFLIIAFILWRFLVRPLMATMKTRREAIAKGLADAEKARTSLAEAGAERAKILQAASMEAYQLLETARQEAERLRAASMERAGRDAERLIEEARDVIALERQAMERDVQGLSLQLSGRILEKAVKDLFTAEEKDRVVARGLEILGRQGGAG